jgi:3-dehydroquinate dehydratase-2
MKKLMIINGPNLNLLGTREPEVYGNETFDSFLEGVRHKYFGMEILYKQSNVEGELVNYIQEAGASEEIFGVVLNAGAYSHTSIAMADAIKAIAKPVVLVHISNVYAREIERRTDLLMGAAEGCITGLGMHGYELALRYLMGKM